MYVVKMQHACSHFIRFFIDVFMYVDFYFLSFRHFNTEPMALTTDVKQQCHHYVGQCMKVDTKVIPHTITYQMIPNYTFIFNLLGGDVLHTSLLGGACEVAKATLTRDAF